MDKTQIFVGLRKKNGQIGYLSEGLRLPEFFDLVRPLEYQVRVLVDYSPVIDKLHHLHKNLSEESIRNKYNSLYNYWQDAKTYSSESLKISKSEELVKLSNSLINELQLKLQKSTISFHPAHSNQHQNYEQWNILSQIKSDCDIYIDTLLCFIHSKASLEIESFRKDTVLTSYISFLHNTVSTMYRNIIKFGRHNESFLKY